METGEQLGEGPAISSDRWPTRGAQPHRLQLPLTPLIYFYKIVLRSCDVPGPVHPAGKLLGNKTNKSCLEGHPFQQRRGPETKQIGEIITSFQKSDKPGADAEKAGMLKPRGNKGMSPLQGGCSQRREEQVQRS